MDKQVKILFFIPEKGLRLSSARNQTLNTILNVMYKGSGVTMMLLTVSLPVAAFTHFNDAIFSLLNPLIVNLSPSFSKWLPHLILILILALFLCFTFLTSVKWLSLASQSLIYVYHCTMWIQNCYKCDKSTTMYRSIYIFITIFNEVYSDMIFSIIFVSVAVPSLGLSVALFHGLSVLSLGLTLISIIFIIVTNINIFEAKIIYASSEKFLYRLKADKLQQSHFMRKSVISLRRCRITSGSLYFIDSEVLRQTNHAIINYTISNILMFKGSL